MTPTPTSGLTFATLVSNLVNLVNNSVLPLLYALAFIFLLYGIVKYFFLGSGEESRDSARNVIVYGFIGIFVLTATWGLVNILLVFLGVHH